MSNKTVPLCFQQFLSAPTPCTFVILIITMQIDNFVLENGKTGETLIGQHFKNDHRLLIDKWFLITRQQHGAESTMLEWIEQNVSRDDVNYCNWTIPMQHIQLCDPKVG